MAARREESLQQGVPCGRATPDATSVTVDDKTLASVTPMTDAHRFVVVGPTPGRTLLHFFVNGRETEDLSVNDTTVGSLPLAVILQPPPQ